MRLGGYHIILVPEDPHKTKRFHLSLFSARLLLLLVLLGIPLITGSIFAIIHYQNRVASLKQKMMEEGQILEQKDILSARLSGLEHSLAKNEQSLEKLGKALDVELGQMETGLGPLDTDSLFDRLNVEMARGGEKLTAMLTNDSDLTLSSINRKMAQMDNRLSGFQSRVEEIYDLNADKIRFMDATPSLMPVDGWITSDFGFRRSPYSGVYRMHYGLDIASPTGAIIHAPADGRVLFADSRAGYGREVILDHGYGVNTVFAHASALFVEEGEKVKRGEPIAAVGSSGASTGPHLHYEVHIDGIPTDPLAYVMK